MPDTRDAMAREEAALAYDRMAARTLDKLLCTNAAIDAYLAITGNPTELYDALETLYFWALQAVMSCSVVAESDKEAVTAARTLLNSLSEKSDKRMTE